MGVKRTMQESEFTPLKPGTYPVTCLAVTADVLENPQFGNGDIIRFKLRFDDVLDAEGEEVTRDVIANDKLTPMSKLTGFLIALNVPCAIGVEVDFDEAVGKKALARVEEVEKNGKTYDRITDLLPPIGKQAVDKPLAEMDISEFWAFTRTQGLERKDVLDMAKELHGKEPKDLTGEERESVIAAL